MVQHFRLCACRASFPAIRRVADFDGAHSLHDVHEWLDREYCEGQAANYAFYLSGRFWDRQSEVLGVRPGRTQGSALERTLRGLRLIQGSTLGYVFLDEDIRIRVEVVSVDKAAAHLDAPVLVESVGEAPAVQDPNLEHEPDGVEDAADALEPVVDRLVEAFDATGTWEQKPRPGNRIQGDEDTKRRRLTAAHDAAVELMDAFAGDTILFDFVERLQDVDFMRILRSLPYDLKELGLVDEGIAVAKAAAELHPVLYMTDFAKLLAMGGRQSEALAQVEWILERIEPRIFTTLEASHVYGHLRRWDDMERLCRSALAEAKDVTERVQVLEYLCPLLKDRGRRDEAEALYRSVEEAYAAAPPTVQR